MQISSPIPDLLNQKLWDGASTFCLHKALQIIWMHRQVWEPHACRIIGRVGGEEGQFRNKCWSKWEVVWQLLVQEPQDLSYAMMRRHLRIKKFLPQLMAPWTASALIREWPDSRGKTLLGSQVHNHTPATIWTVKMYGLPLSSLNSGPNLRPHLTGKTYHIQNLGWKKIPGIEISSFPGYQVEVFSFSHIPLTPL